MSNRDLLKQLGWSDELIDAVEKSAFGADTPPSPSIGTDLYISPIKTSEEGNSIDLSGVDFSSALWPHF